MTLHSLTPVEEPYRRQMTSYRRTRSAILEGTKKLIANVGLQRTNMIDIADASEVSRATLYNHFRDKGSVLRAVLESEIERVFLVVDSEMSPSEALRTISHEISTDPALDMMRKTDVGALAQLLVKFDDSLWQHVDTALAKLLGNENVATIARLWLVGQVLQPLSAGEIQEQARVIVSLASPQLN